MHIYFSCFIPCTKDEGEPRLRSNSSCLQCISWAVIKSWEAGDLVRPLWMWSQLLSYKNRTKIESKEIPSRLIPRLIVAFTRQLEILATTLELLGNLKPSYLFYLGLGDITIEWNTGKNLKTHLGPAFHAGVIINHSMTLPHPLYPRRLDKP